MVEERRHRPGLMGPILLITLGIILLLSSLGLLQVSLWELWRLWPLLLVLAGLDILSSHSRWGSALAAVLGIGVVGLVLLLLVAMPEPLRPFLSRDGDLVINPIHQDLGSVERAEVDLTLGFGELYLSDLEDSSRLFDGRLNYPQRWGSAPRVSYEVSDGVGRLRLASRSQGVWAVPFGSSSRGEQWAVRLSRRVPLSIKVDAGASSSVLDLSHLQLAGLRVKAGVGRMEVRFPAEGERMTATIEGGVGELVLRIPESVAVRIEVEGGLGAKHLGSRFEPAGADVFETPGYGTAANRLEISVDGGLGTLRVE